MSGWLNWRAIEKNNDWGVRAKDDETAAMWSQGAAGWEARSQSEDDFNRRQVEELKLSKEDHVIDICCGPGPLTRWIAPKVYKVTAYDYSESMLAYVKEKAEKYSLDNIEYLQGNFNTMVPGIDGPIADVAVTRHSPAQGNILRFSRWAGKKCYSLNAVYPAKRKTKNEASYFIKSAAENGGKLNLGERPDGRLYGFQVHFNLLYDMGANPSVSYVKNEICQEAVTKEELFMKSRNMVSFDLRLYDEWCRRMEDKIRYDGNVWIYSDIQLMSVLSWNPADLDYDKAAYLGY